MKVKWLKNTHDSLGEISWICRWESGEPPYLTTGKLSMCFRFEVVFNFSFTLHINSLSSRACWDLLSLGWLRSIRGCRRLTLLRRNLMLDNLHTRNNLLWGCNMSWFIIFFYGANLRKQKINVHYYSFNIFLHFWLARIPPIILHDQLTLTKFGRPLRYPVKWRQQCRLSPEKSSATEKL